MEATPYYGPPSTNAQEETMKTPDYPANELREKLSELIYHWIYVQAHPEYTAHKMSRKADRFADKTIKLFEAYTATQTKAKLSELLEKLKENQKGQFEDDGGSICWYLDDLVSVIERTIEEMK